MANITLCHTNEQCFSIQNTFETFCMEYFYRSLYTTISMGKITVINNGWWAFDLFQQNDDNVVFSMFNAKCYIRFNYTN